MGYGFRNYGYRRPSYESLGGGGGGGGGFRFFITPGVKLLLILNIGLFLFVGILLGSTGLRTGQVVHFFGLAPGAFFRGFFWQPLTYLFLHAGFGHLLMNMFVLWMFGTPLERDWGTRRFLRYYFITGIGAGLFIILMTSASVLAGWAAAGEMGRATIGASGAIFGLLLAFGLLYPNAPVYVMFIFPIPARILVIGIGIMTFMLLPGQATSRISHVAHLGGMVVGYLYLRGPGGMLFGLRKVYANWQLNRARRKFRVYVRDMEERERDRSHPEDWIN